MSRSGNFHVGIRQILVSLLVRFRHALGCLHSRVTRLGRIIRVLTSSDGELPERSTARHLPVVLQSTRTTPAQSVHGPCRSRLTIQPESGTVPE